ARHVAVVFAGLVGAAHDDFVDGRRIQFRRLGQHGLEHLGGQVVGADRRQGAAEATDGGAAGMAQINGLHWASPWATGLAWCSAVLALSERSISSSSAEGSGVSAS